MINRLTLLAAPALAFVLANPAHAAETHGLYLGAEAGAVASPKLSASGASIDLSDGLSYGASLGYDFGPIRAEIEGSRLTTKTNVGVDVNAGATFYGANLYVEPFAFGKIEPYVMGGYGHLDGKLSVPFGSVEADGAAYQYGVGSSYALTDGVTLNAGWKHLQADDLKGVDFTADRFEAGIRLKLA